MSVKEKVLEGSYQDIKDFAEVLVSELNGRAKSNGNPQSAMSVLSYTIPIMGNPRNPKSVCLKVELDQREGGKSRIKVQSGFELLQWQAKSKSLCNSCIHCKVYFGKLTCRDLQEPDRKKRSCRSYKHQGNS